MKKMAVTSVEAPSVAVEKDFYGTVHIKLGYPGEEPFDFVQIQYDHRFTSNSRQKELADRVVATIRGTGDELETLQAGRDERMAECPELLVQIEQQSREIERLKLELQALQGIQPELPPKPPEDDGLPRYGLGWNGPGNPLAVPMDDGYWTPWHLADAEIKALQALRESDQRPLDIRMKEAGMQTVEEMLTNDPLEGFFRHAGVRDLDTFQQWLDMKYREYLTLQTRLSLDKREDDEMFEWALAHAAVFKVVRANFQAALSSRNTPPSSPDKESI